MRLLLRGDVLKISAGFGISREQIEGFARSIAGRIETEIPAYARVPGSPIKQDLIEIETRNLELYLRALADERLPDPAELADLEVASGIRLRQGFPHSRRCCEPAGSRHRRCGRSWWRTPLRSRWPGWPL